MSVKTATKKKRTLREQLDDALADAAAIEAELYDANARIKKREEDLDSQSSGMLYVEEYEEHNKKRNAELKKIRNRLDRRDKSIAKLEAEHVQTVVSMREQVTGANAESVHNAQAMQQLKNQVNALELTLEKQHATLTNTITVRGVRIDDLDLENEVLRAENARLKAVEHLHKRPSAVRAVGRLVTNRGWGR